MSESACVFGPGGQLIGVLQLPDVGHGGGPIVLAFNAGVLPRVGPRRVNVKLAHALAARGIGSFRFDLSGQGDSRASVSADDFAVQAVRDIRAAMDHLETLLGCRRFILFGICSGAVHAFSAARQDERVVGALMFDGHSYGTWLTRTVRHFKRFRAISWRATAGALGRRAGRLVGRASSAGTADGVEAMPIRPESANPPRPVFVEAMRMLARRRADLCFVYSGSALEYYSYRLQFRHAFWREAFSRTVRVEYLEEVDHTFVSVASQNRLIGLACDWLASLTPDPSGA